MRELRLDPSVGDTRVVFCTATYAMEEVRKLADSCGVSHILVKPCEPELIISVVSEALGPIGDSSPRTVSNGFDREQLRVLNAKLTQKVTELEALSLEQGRLHGDLRQAERQTAESLTLLETLQASAPVGFGFVDRDFRIRRINDTLAGINGVSVERQLGRTVADVAPNDWPHVEHVYRRVLDTGQPVLNRGAQREDPTVPGRFRHWLASYYPVQLAGEVIGVGVVVVDVTERQQANDLRSAVMQTMAEGLYVTDAEGRLVLMNASASRMTGWTEEELRGKSIHAAIHYQRADGSPFDEKNCEALESSARRSTGIESK